MERSLKAQLHREAALYLLEAMEEMEAEAEVAEL